MSIAEGNASVAPSLVGPLEARHLQSPIYRNAADPTPVTSTHWQPSVEPPTEAIGPGKWWNRA